MHLILHTDGGARGNPGPAGIGVVIKNAETGEIVEQHSEFIGHTTNNQAEYRAVILGLRRCVALGATEVEVVADSELLIKQAKGEYKVKNRELASRYVEMKNLETHIGRVRYRHVRREKNKEADALANAAMDKGMRRSVGD
ncbi:MAG: ribonuclease HI family protein [Candidatus Uhrbacteria bacterium]|nr:ribonuclease HI family protein [Candidatus Uhrbacteria bacterium]